MDDIIETIRYSDWIRDANKLIVEFNTLAEKATVNGIVVWTPEHLNKLLEIEVAYKKWICVASKVEINFGSGERNSDILSDLTKMSHTPMAKVRDIIQNIHKEVRVKEKVDKLVEIRQHYFTFEDSPPIMYTDKKSEIITELKDNTLALIHLDVIENGPYEQERNQLIKWMNTLIDKHDK